MEPEGLPAIQITLAILLQPHRKTLTAIDFNGRVICRQITGRIVTKYGFLAAALYDHIATGIDRSRHDVLTLQIRHHQIAGCIDGQRRMLTYGFRTVISPLALILACNWQLTCCTSMSPLALISAENYCTAPQGISISPLAFVWKRMSPLCFQSFGNRYHRKPSW